MQTEIDPKTSLPIFDVQIDGNHKYDEGKTEIDLYPVYRNASGLLAVSTLQTVHSVEIPSDGYSDDIWCATDEALVPTLPEHIVAAYNDAVKTATDRYFAEHGNDPR